jgi:hypothetical protein
MQAGRDAGQGRALFGCARMKEKRGGSRQTHTEGNEAAHGGSLARMAAERPAMRQDRSEARVRQQRKEEELCRVTTCRAATPRPNWCTGRSHAVREVLQRDNSGRTHPGGSRVMRNGH